MSRPAFRPGPLTIVREADPAEHDDRRWIASLRDGPVEVARVAVFGEGTPSHKTALLLAAAPDLYAACSPLAVVLEAIAAGRALPTAVNWTRLSKGLRDALAKAEEPR